LHCGPLEKSKRVESFRIEEQYGYESACRVTELGIEWLLDHQGNFSLESSEKRKTKAAAAGMSPMPLSDDDVPF
jgi:hypothetical protein